MSDGKPIQYTTNPFPIEGIGEKFVVKTGMAVAGKVIVDEETAEVQQLYTAPKSELRPQDSRAYVKLYIAGATLAKELSPAALKMYLFIAFHLKPCKDTIILEQTVVCGWTGINKSSFYRARTELSDKEVTARRKRDEYWINPNIFFNGSRLKLPKT